MMNCKEQDMKLRDLS